MAGRRGGTEAATVAAPTLAARLPSHCSPRDINGVAPAPLTPVVAVAGVAVIAKGWPLPKPLLPLMIFRGGRTGQKQTEFQVKDGQVAH